MAIRKVDGELVPDQRTTLPDGQILNGSVSIAVPDCVPNHSYATFHGEGHPDEVSLHVKLTQPKSVVWLMPESPRK